MLPDREEELGSKMYNERQRPFLILVSMGNPYNGGYSALPEIVRTIFVGYNKDCDFWVLLDRIDAVRGIGVVFLDMSS